MPSILERARQLVSPHIGKSWPRAYYNEIDPEAAEWLVELIAAGFIPVGDVDRRSIKDVHPDEVSHYTQCHFFAGVGGWALALRQAGWPDDRPAWTGSCPCQPYSRAGKRKGSDDERDLWPAFYALIRQCKPEIVFGEQVASTDVIGPAGSSRSSVQAADRRPWIDIVFDDLEAAHYTCGAIPFPAAGVGSPQIRDRLYWMADATGGQEQRLWQREASGAGAARGRRTDGAWSDIEWIECADGRTRPVEPGIEPVAAGLPEVVGRLRGYGNALCVPAAAEFVAAYLGIDHGSDAGADEKVA